MKRGIPIALLAAGMIVACQVASLNHPKSAFVANDSALYVAFYYNEAGVLMKCDTNGKREGYFVIRTKYTRRQLFPDWYNRDTTEIAKYYRPADVTNIKPRKAKLVEDLIRQESWDDVLIELNVVPILDKEVIRKLLDTIADSGTNTNSATDFREYGGLIRKDLTFTYRTGDSSDPCSTKNYGVKPGNGGIADYHSHPSGERWDVDSNGDPVKCNFMQGTSHQDQEVVHKGRLGYVFGMRKGYHRIYIYDSTGIVATLPFSYLDAECNKK